jgi:hypothetical protein
MSTIDDEMYDYLTEPENYKAAKDVSDLLNRIVEPRLNKEFFFEVRRQLKIKLNESMNNELKDYVVDESVETLNKSNWNGVTISRENDDLGIKIDIDLINRDKVMELLVEKNSGGRLGEKETLWWPCYHQNHFNCVGDFFNKLPKTRETKISELANIIFNYVEKATVVCDEINKMRK